MSWLKASHRNIKDKSQWLISTVVPIGPRQIRHDNIKQANTRKDMMYNPLEECL